MAETDCYIRLCLSVRIKQLGSHWTDLDSIYNSNIFRKSFEKIKLTLKSKQKNGYLTRKTCVHL